MKRYQSHDWVSRKALRYACVLGDTILSYDSIGIDWYNTVHQWLSGDDYMSRCDP
jgi:hypothetical protein